MAPPPHWAQLSVKVQSSIFGVPPPPFLIAPPALTALLFVKVHPVIHALLAVLEIPPPEDAVRLRRKALDGLSRHFLQEAHRMGFEADEVRANLDDLISLWLKTGEPPEDDN